MYSINYLCDNCGCNTNKTYTKGKTAPQSVDCANCGCVAQKSVGSKNPPKVLPKDEPEPWNPWGVDPWEPKRKPYKYPDWDYKRYPYKVTWSEMLNDFFDIEGRK